MVVSCIAIKLEPTVPKVITNCMIMMLMDYLEYFWDKFLWCLSCICYFLKKGLLTLSSICYLCLSYLSLMVCQFLCLVTGCFNNVISAIISPTSNHVDPAFSILITGRCGSGKSALINALLGETVVPERPGVHNKSRSSEILAFTSTNVHPVRVLVSTQLQHQDYNDEKQYKRDLKEKCGEVDLIIYCLKMTETRFTPGNPDEVAMEKLFNALGPDSLKKTIFALTFANNAAAMLETETFQRNATDQWPKIITDTLNKVTRVTSDVEVVPVGYYKEPSLPTCQNWLEHMWCQCLEVMPEPSQAMMAANNKKRFRLQSEGTSAVPRSPSSAPIVFSSQQSLDKYCLLATQDADNFKKLA